ncbi:MAG: hypothetical protein DRP00_04045 [Candidatus Aenigmatarchaeota archaeon]|nr:MAG: hypothetical protein DRP00_04045 [Candidatus Aenigmarchaeota archaeon]
MSKLRETLEDTLQVLVSEIDEKEAKIIAEGIPRYAQKFNTFLRMEKRKLPSMFRILEELSQITGILRLSIILEHPSPRMALRER